MQKIAKVVAIVSNLVCLLSTLLMPSSATLIILMPLVAAACSWILGAVDEQRSLPLEKQNKKHKRIVYLFCGWGIMVFIGSLLVAIFCEFLFDSGVPSWPMISFRASVTALGGIQFSYLPYAVITGLIIAPLYIGELVVPHQPPSINGQSICCEIAAEILKANS